MALSQDIYELLTDEDDARLCEEIGEEACRETPRSFVRILASNILTRLADALVSPKTTLAWLTTALGAPAFVLGFLVPIRESGSMIPQLFIGSAVRRLPRRKWVWVAGSIGQCLCAAGLGAVAFTLTGAAAGWAILALVLLFSLARSLCSVAAKDVLGKTVPKAKRGQLAGWSASAAGLLSILVGVALILPVTRQFAESIVGVLLIAAGLLWLAASLIFARVEEQAGETGGGRNVFDALGRLDLLRRDRKFRRFIITRALLMCSALSAPFYVALGQANLGSDLFMLGTFVVAAGLALSTPNRPTSPPQSNFRRLLLSLSLPSLLTLISLPRWHFLRWTPQASSWALAAATALPPRGSFPNGDE